MASAEPPANATSTVNRVVFLLGAIALLTIAGTIFLAAIERPVPGELIALASASAGALGALLASTRSVDVAGLNELAGLTTVQAAQHPARQSPEELAAAIVPDPQAGDNAVDGRRLDGPGAPGA